MLDDHGYGLSRRRVTVSTSGVVPMIDRLRDDCPVALAVSLHAPERRAARRAGAAQPQVPDRRAAGRLQAATSSARRATSSPSSTACSTASTTRRRSTRAQLAARCVQHGGTGVPCKFNLIPFNPFPASGLKRSPHGARRGVREVLQEAGIVTTVRKTRGDDIDAACGQLAGDVQDRTRVAERRARARRCASLRRCRGAAPATRRAGAAAMTTQARRCARARRWLRRLAARRAARGLRDRRTAAAGDARHATASPRPTSPSAQKRARSAAWSSPSAYFSRGQTDDRARPGQARDRRRPDSTARRTTCAA